MRLLTLLLIFLLFLQGNNTYGQQFSKTLIQGFPKLHHDAGFQFADFNNDDTLDLFVYGIIDSANLNIMIFKNFKDSSSLETFITNIPCSFPGTFQLADLNNDNSIDVILSSINKGTQATSVFFNDGNFLFQEPIILDSTYHPNFSLGDINNDGRKDILLNNITSTDKFISLWLNTIKEFKKEILPIPAISRGGSVIFDYNKDGRPDFFHYGYDSLDNYISGIYQNKGGLKFDLKRTLIDSLVIKNLLVNDFDSDGKKDFLIFEEISGSNKEGKIYYSSENSFTEGAPGFLNIDSLKSHSADFNHDGTTDIILSGKDTSGNFQVNIYYNKLNSSFERIDSIFTQLSNGKIAIGDITQNGNLDIVYAGFSDSSSFIYTYKNLNGVYNSAPSIPINLHAVTIGAKTILTWDESNDDVTSSKAISYDVFVNSDDRQVFSSLESHGIYGTRKVVSEGKVYNNFYVINNLPDGNYVWGVSAIDNSFHSGYRKSNGFCMGGFKIINQRNPRCLEINRIDTLICKGQTIKIIVPPSNSSAVWFSTNKGLLQISDTLLAKAEEADTIYYVLEDPYDCEKNFSLTLNIGEGSLIELGSDTSICKGGTIKTPADTNFNKYFWYLGYKLISQNIKLNNYFINHSTHLWAVVRNNEGCYSSDSIYVTVNPDIFPIKDTTVCYGVPLIFIVNENIKSAIWKIREDGITLEADRLTFIANEEKKVEVSGVTNNGCSVEDSIKIRIFPTLTMLASKNVFVSLGDSISLSVANLNNYTWTDAKRNLIKSDYYAPSKSEHLYLKGKDKNNCLLEDSIKFIVQGDIFIPNLISPNNDFINDQFQVFGTAFRRLELKITDRIGNILFQSNDISLLTSYGWDGKVNGNDAPPGLYFWSIKGEYEDGRAVKFNEKVSGSFTLIR